MLTTVPWVSNASSEHGRYDHEGQAGSARLRAWVREDFGVALTATERVGHGADAAATVWHAVGTDGRRHAVKWSGGGSLAGLLVPALLAARGVSGIPAPLPARDGAPWSDREGRRLSLTPWVSDLGALEADLTERQWRAYGALLARTHATPPDDETRSVLPREAHTHGGETAGIRAVGEALARTGAAAQDALTRQLAALWGEASATVTALLARTDTLGHMLRAREAAGEEMLAVLCHGDPHLGNVLLRDGRPWLIGWEDTVLAPPERDLLTVLGGTLDSTAKGSPGWSPGCTPEGSPGSTSEGSPGDGRGDGHGSGLGGVLPFAPVTGREQAWFLAGYGPARPDPDRLAYYRCRRALADLAGPAAHALDQGVPQHERADALALLRGALSPTGLATLTSAPSRP